MMFLLIFHAYAITFTLIDGSKGSPQVSGTNPYVLNYPCSTHDVCTGYKAFFDAGIYRLEVWGAEGGRTTVVNSFGYTPVQAGKGGYSTGILTLKTKTQVFIYVGGSPTPRTDSTYKKVTGGFNGGGTNIGSSGTNCNAGGGATDIRIGEDSLYNRVIVAGGGGSGGYFDGSKSYYGGAGGGSEGQASGFGTSTNGGKQNGPGTGGYQNQNGAFGYGGNHTLQSGGAGGGWFGGASSGNGGANTGGGGGSGYVFNKTSYVPDGFKLNPDYYLMDGTTISGLYEIPSPNDAQSKESGHSGHGIVRIMALGKVNGEGDIKYTCLRLLFSLQYEILRMLMNFLAPALSITPVSY